jgi:hypothetical protein
MSTTAVLMFAAYACAPCDVRGLDPELSPGVARCWNCGELATVTARLTRPAYSGGAL